MGEGSANPPSHFRFRVAVASCVALVALIASVLTWSDGHENSFNELIALPFDPNQPTAQLSSSNADVGSLAKVSEPTVMIQIQINIEDTYTMKCRRS